MCWYSMDWSVRRTSCDDLTTSSVICLFLLKFVERYAFFFFSSKVLFIILLTTASAEILIDDFAPKWRFFDNRSINKGWMIDKSNAFTTRRSIIFVLFLVVCLLLCVPSLWQFSLSLFFSRTLLFSLSLCLSLSFLSSFSSSWLRLIVLTASACSNSSCLGVEEMQSN